MSTRPGCLLLLLAASLVAAGCEAGKKDISEVRSCLKGLGLQVESLEEQDQKEQVEEGVLATTDLTKGDAKRFTLAMAAYARSDKDVKTFEDGVKDFSKALSVGQELVIDSQTDGRYVWVVAGVKKDETFEDAVGCVD